MSNRLSRGNQTVLLLYALIGFIALNPYFIWSSYYNGTFNKIGYILSSLLFLIIVINFNKGIKFKKNNIFLGLSFLLIYIYTETKGIEPESLLNLLIRIGVYSLVIFSFLLLDNVKKKTVYRYFKRIFAISLISGLFFFVLLNIGIIFPYDIIQTTHSLKAAAGQFYIHYPGSVFLSGQGSQFFRLSGMFDEPGVVGTVSALLLVGDNFRIKNSKENLIILLGGALSFSLAFFAITFLGLFLKYLRTNIKTFSLFIVVVIIIITTLINMETENPLIKRYIQDRVFVEDQIIVSNRANDTFNYGYERFLNGNMTEVLFGNGHKTASENVYMAGSYHYKMLIYDYGYFGFLMIVLWLIISGYFINGKNKSGIILLLLFLISMYQRPYVFSFDYMILLFGGLANLKCYYNQKPKNKYQVDPKLIKKNKIELVSVSQK